MRGSSWIVALLAFASLFIVTRPLGAGVLVSYSASSGGTPEDVANPWHRFGVPMTNSGGILHQDNTADDPGNDQSGEYLSPPAGAGTMMLASGQYGVQVKARPLTDVPFLGGSNYANAYVTWSDDSFSYNITLDKFTDDVSGTGGIKYGKDSMSDAVTGIDWSLPHTIYVGYNGISPFGSFDFYVDGTLSATVSAGSMARTGSFAQDAVDFGDGTTGQGRDAAVDWYSVGVFNQSTPPSIPEPTLSILVPMTGLLILRRWRRV